MAVFDDNAERILLVDLEPYDVNAASTTTLRVASTDYATEPTDTPASALYFGVVQDDVFFDRAMFTGNNVGGISLPDVGFVSIMNPNQPDIGAEFDTWLDPDVYTWQGRDITISILEKGAAYSTRTTLFTGVIKELQYEENVIRVSFRSKSYLLDEPIQANRYAGSGGDEGGADLKGKPKPLLFGRVSNMQPVIVDTSTLRYQLHDGAAQANDETRDKGSALTITTDYTNDLSNGFIDLVAAADGIITMDAQGSTLGGTYSAQPADIMEYIVETLRGITDIDTASIAAVNSARGYEIGYYTGTENPTYLQVLTDIAQTFNGYFGFNRDGEFDVGIFDAPSGAADIEIGEQDIEMGSLVREPLGDIVHKVTVNLRPNVQVQDKDSFAGGVSEADKALYSKEYQISVTASDATVLTKYPEAKELTVNTNIYDETDAQDLADALLAYWKTPRSKFRLATNLRPLSINLNDVVNLTHSRYNLSAGKKFNVIRFREYYLRNRVELTLAG